MEKGQIRQGDVLLIPVKEEKPENASLTTRVVLAIGEHTGHIHVLEAPQVYQWEIDGQRYVQVMGSVGTITHQEHDPKPAPVVVPDTTYRVVIQREWDLKGQWRQVVD